MAKASCVTLIALAVALVAGSSRVAQAQELKVGNIYRDSVQISKGMGGIFLPLPSAEWRLLSVEQSRISGVGYNVPEERGSLVSLDFDRRKNQIKSLIAYSLASTDSEYAGWESHPVCDDPDQYYVFKSDQNRRRRQVKCWAIKLHAVKAATQLPPLLIGVTYFWSERTKGLQVTYYFNPETAGFAPLTQEGWSKRGITGDPRRVKYVEDLKTWATEWQAKIERGFAGKIPQSAVH